MSFASLLELDLTVKLFELLGPVGTAALDVASRQHLHSIHEPWPKEGDHELGTELVAFCEPSRSRRPKPTGAGLFVSRATVTTMKLNQAWGAARKCEVCVAMCAENAPLALSSLPDPGERSLQCLSRSIFARCCGQDTAMPIPRAD